MIRSLKNMIHQIAAAMFLMISSILTGCVTTTVAPLSNIEMAEGAFTVPYRISSSGRFLIDVSINEGAARPLSVDTGATVSVVYDEFAKATDLAISDQTRFVRGLVGQGDRPVIEDVKFQIGVKTFPLSQVVTLETPKIKDEAVGLIGGDILTGYTVLFNRATMTATFSPRGNVDEKAFAGWRHIPLENYSDVETDANLYFAEAIFQDLDVPVLVDTGSNINFINWKLATLDKTIQKIERDMVRNGMLQGALDSTPATLETVFYDLKLGDQAWDEISVVVTGLDGLASIAPVDAPMMVAGAKLFNPLTVAFDLEGQSLYVYPDGKR